MNATYVYCLVQSARAPLLRGVPDTIPGAGAVRLLPIDRGLWAVVADAPLDRFSGDRLQQDLQDLETVSRHALAHAGVIEFFFRKSPVIPLKMLTLFSNDVRAQQHLRNSRAKLARMFVQLRGLEEWGARVIAGEVEAESAKTLTSGRDYLQVKRRLHDQSSAPARSTVRAANGALKELGRTATKVRKEAFPPPGKGRPYVTGASFLVRSRRRTAWKKQVAALTKALAREGHRLEVSGPWPPYHFVTG